MDLKEALRDELTEDELGNLVKSFEVVGDVAIIEVPEELHHRKELIGEKLMELNNHINTVLREVSGRKGEFRTRDYELIAGEEDTETLHKEHGCRFRLDPTEVYFSEREGKERQRIAEKVGDGETVMVMFAGIGPFPVVIARKNTVESIYAVELNPHAFKYLRKNVSLNKLEEVVEPLEGDVRNVCPKYFGKCDRVLMPLPKDSANFLDLAVKCLKKEGGIVHYYSWGEEGSLYDEAEKHIREAAARNNMVVEITDRRKVLPYAPRKWKICLDCKFKNK